MHHSLNTQQIMETYKFLRISGHRSLWSCLVLIYLMTTFTTGQSMRIESFKSDGRRILKPGSTVTLGCNIVLMDTGRFVQLGKLLPADQTQRVVFSTNTNVEQIIRSVERYSVGALRVSGPPEGPDSGQDSPGYTFTLRINDVRLEDAGVYFCSVPSLNLTEYVEVNIFAEPERIELYVDGVMAADRSHVTFDSSTTHELRCTTTGSYPQTVFKFSLGGNTAEEDSDVISHDTLVTTHRVTTKQLSSYPEFFAHTTFTTTSVVKDAFIDFLSAGHPITCSASIPGTTSSTNQLSTSFIPIFTGWAPEFSCKRYVMTSPLDDNVTVTCLIHAKPAANDIFVYYFTSELPQPSNTFHNNSDAANNSATNSQSKIHNLYPVESSHPTGRKDRALGGEKEAHGQDSTNVLVSHGEDQKNMNQNDDDDEFHKVTVKQSDNESTTVQLSLNTKESEAYRDYYFVASNKYGTSLHVVTLLEDPSYAALIGISSAQSSYIQQHYYLVLLLPISSVFLSTTLSHSGFR